MSQENMNLELPYVVLSDKVVSMVDLSPESIVFRDSRWCFRRPARKDVSHDFSLTHLNPENV